MPNNKFYGYTPKMSSEEKRLEASTEFNNRLNKYNPFEFRKGMDFELTEMGCTRLRESTVEEREKATENVLKNLEEIPNYYTSLLTYESLFKNVKGTKPTFNAWTKEQENNKMQELEKGFDRKNVTSDVRAKNLKTPKFDDQMTEPKYDKKEYTIPAQVKASSLKENKITKLKEAIKRQIKSKLLEQDIDLDIDPEGADKAATKAAKKGKKGKKDVVKKSDNRFDNEIKAIENLLWRGNEEGSEYTEKEPHPDSLIGIRVEEFNKYKSERDKGAQDLDDWVKILKELNEKHGIPSIETHINEYGPVTDGNPKAAGNDVSEPDLKGDDFFQTIKKFQARIKSIKEEKSGETDRQIKMTRELAQYQMERNDHIRLLEIIKENGVSLKEGAMGVKNYYEIAKTAYLEGLSKGLNL